MKRLQQISWIGSACAIVALVSLIVLNPSALKPKSVSKLYGGPFEMTSHKGEKVTDKDLKGKPFAIFFGFTHCPEACPTILQEITNTIEELGDDADKMNYLFVSVDPERDTQQLLADFISNFDKRIIALRGTPEQTEKITKAYKIYYAKVGSGKDYNINHTVNTFLMNARGKFVGTFKYKEEAENRLKKLRRLISSK